MAEHYYSKNPGSKSAQKHWTFHLRGRKLSFSTDQGVFSKDEVDFGSRTLIESFEEPSIQGEFLDLGCGYGPIGLSLALDYPERKVVMADVNDRALELAKKNAEQNNATNVEVLESDQFQAFEGRKFASILTNPPIRAGKEVVHSMLKQSFEALLPHGELWVVIQKKQGAPSAQSLLEEMFDEVEIVKRSKGYYIFKAKKIDSDLQV
ncbi:class I SAM-dependent methyltransferase [Pontibacillus yanchengensis]|uniref:16S rRNA methyltransferase n=1 Tax=Pontibacillus yanchengensis Y32 TaxID=1385514 RepID=A0A0A2TTA4_9BACI|nr:class I SAM-dependent methyltransferase [Pontibacillus yanchengensis]KGP72500.1 16S rRNA methyltransferase [Pontibacillus yanchengensis Y32]